ncbi:MAG: glycosyltransferase [Methylococcales bacterium]
MVQNQFGTLIDTFFYSKYLRDRFNITIICWDYSLKKQMMDGVDIIYISRNGNIIQRNVRYIYESYNWLKRNPSNVCFIKHFRGCSILKLLLPRLKFVFDIRTASVSTKPHTRFIYDKAMMFESYFFRHITVISESLSNKLKLSKKSYILPLGSEAISNTTKTFDSLRLLYVGTLDARDIDKTVSAFAKFYKHNKNVIKMNYTIVGDGPGDEIEQLKTIVEKNSLSDVVNIVGRVPFTELKPYFDTHNIGVSFVPLTEYFDSQPVTKTFDYLLSGMPVVATATSENKIVISSSNGVLINDTVESFYKGLKEIWHEKESYNSDQIVSMSSKYNWSDIVDNLGDYLNKVSISK